ncbi:hypothetical protein [Sporosarcina sp. P17b]|uniref:hypothetical protein n=1 Tax=Sporosarcina sp. P17b TaxID=2048260 RepID=UPI000C17376F|nr:hypothetical protein [Sporosarcina sp. P17b]PIC72506.1 hypothetical protein CSV76_14850 [Sporosarcina sp. P17b]
MSDMILAGNIIAAAWTISLILTYQHANHKGWIRGHEDTKSITFKVLENKKRKIEEQARKKE